MTPVEEIRQAAALIRQRAEAARPGGPRWETEPDERTPSRRYVLPADSDSAITSAAADDAEHIASWHPGVALAVADWLDAEAESAITVNQAYIHVEKAFGHALKVARVYLGGAT